ncbi:MAG TPA: hypothetical protein PK629_03390 [Oscillospiraceae bacterium]|nr:hypothetical protein [Oscillospiraceae bacterium]HPK34744.1 hypothetical protein [Oscillospiraceae bacterium]
MRKLLVVILTGLFLLAGCSKAGETIKVEIDQPELPEFLLTWQYGTFLDTNGDLYTWGYDFYNVELEPSYKNSLGQGTEVIYNNIPTKIYSDVADVSLGRRALTNGGNLVEWGILMEDDPCVPHIVEGNVAKIYINMFITQNAELYIKPENETIALKKSYEESGELVTTGVQDVAVGYAYFALKSDGSVWMFKANSTTVEITEKPKELIDDIKKYTQARQ